MAAPRLDKELADYDNRRATDESLQKFKEESNRIDKTATYLNLMVRGVNLNLFGKTVMKGRSRKGSHRAPDPSAWNMKELRQHLRERRIPYKGKNKTELLQLVQTQMAEVRPK
jgi:hypothetical protein